MRKTFLRSLYLCAENFGEFFLLHLSLSHTHILSPLTKSLLHSLFHSLSLQHVSLRRLQLHSLHTYHPILSIQVNTDFNFILQLRPTIKKSSEKISFFKSDFIGSFVRRRSISFKLVNRIVETFHRKPFISENLSPRSCLVFEPKPTPTPMLRSFQRIFGFSVKIPKISVRVKIEQMANPVISPKRNGSQK